MELHFSGGWSSWGRSAKCGADSGDEGGRGGRRWVLKASHVRPEGQSTVPTRKAYQDVVGVGELHRRDGVVVPLAGCHVVLVVGGHGERPTHAVGGGGVVAAAWGAGRGEVRGRGVCSSQGVFALNVRPSLPPSPSASRPVCGAAHGARAIAVRPHAVAGVLKVHGVAQLVEEGVEEGTPTQKGRATVVTVCNILLHPNQLALWGNQQAIQNAVSPPLPPPYRPLSCSSPCDPPPPHAHSCRPRSSPLRTCGPPDPPAAPGLFTMH